MEQFRKRLTNELIISFIIIIALIAGILFFKGNISSYAMNIMNARTELSRISSGVLELSRLQAQYNEAAGYFDVLSNIVPSYYNLINLNKDLQSIASSNNLSYSFSFAGENPKTADGFGSINFNLAVSSANLNDLLSFLNSLQKFKYLTAVDGVSFNSSQGTNIITMSVKGRVFYK
ncbi:hypothetical protein M1506_01150 [Patescibacteria group bacterium]|nr:hypothetical protein [Patescibacteria group bacterium]